MDKKLGQIFTKKEVAKYMVNMLDCKKDSLILDPCFGDGVFLDTLLINNYYNCIGCEIDPSLFSNYNNKNKKIDVYNIDYLKYKNSKKFDAIIMNPPYIRHEKINDLKEYGITKEIIKKNKIYNKLKSNSNMYMYFVVKAINDLKKNGELVVIFPSSWINNECGQVFKKCIEEKCTIKEEINISGNLFEDNALVEVFILKIIKSKKCDNLKQSKKLLLKDGALKDINSIKKNNINFNNFVPFSSLCRCRRGLTTGFNSFFINPEVNDLFCEPIVSSPKQILGYTTNGCNYDKLLCHIDISNKELNKYIKKYERIIVSEKKPKVLFEKILNKENWYDIHVIPCNGILFSYFIRDDIKFVNNDNFIVRDNFYVIYPLIDKMLCLSLLNNYYVYYQLEKIGKKYGNGLLKIQKYDFEEVKIPNYVEYEEKDINKLIQNAKEMIKTSNKKIVEENTKIISKYTGIKYDEIINYYHELKGDRLEKYDE